MLLRIPNYGNEDDSQPMNWRSSRHHRLQFCLHFQHQVFPHHSWFPISVRALMYYHPSSGFSCVFVIAQQLNCCTKPLKVTPINNLLRRSKTNPWEKLGKERIFGVKNAVWWQNAWVTHAFAVKLFNYSVLLSWIVDEDKIATAWLRRFPIHMVRKCPFLWVFVLVVCNSLWIYDLFFIITASCRSRIMSNFVYFTRTTLNSGEKGWVGIRIWHHAFTNCRLNSSQ